MILARHAEKAFSQRPNRDPELSLKGSVRALRLATLLGKTAVTRLVATEYTARRRRSSRSRRRSAKSVEVRSAAQTNDRVRELHDAAAGSTAVVATHANVLPMIVRELAGARLPGLEEARSARTTTRACS